MEHQWEEALRRDMDRTVVSLQTFVEPELSQGGEGKNQRQWAL